jgi:hypothetical protein
LRNAAVLVFSAAANHHPLAAQTLLRVATRALTVAADLSRRQGYRLSMAHGRSHRHTQRADEHAALMSDSVSSTRARPTFTSAGLTPWGWAHGTTVRPIASAPAKIKDLKELRQKIAPAAPAAGPTRHGRFMLANVGLDLKTDAQIPPPRAAPRRLAAVLSGNLDAADLDAARAPPKLPSRVIAVRWSYVGINLTRRSYIENRQR